MADEAKKVPLSDKAKTDEDRRIDTALSAARGLLQYLETTGKDRWDLSPSYERHVSTLRGALNALESAPLPETAVSDPRDAVCEAAWDLIGWNDEHGLVATWNTDGKRVVADLHNALGKLPVRTATLPTGSGDT